MVGGAGRKQAKSKSKSEVNRRDEGTERGEHCDEYRTATTAWLTTIINIRAAGVQSSQPIISIHQEASISRTCTYLPPTAMAHQISITLPPGPLGVGLRRSDTGQCYINSKTNASSPLLVGDIIVKMNGIVLADVQDGTQAWPKLFQAFASMPKNLVVLRRIRTAVAAPPAPMIVAPINAAPKTLDKPLNSDLLALRAEQAKRPPPAPMIIAPDSGAPKPLDKPLNSDLLALRAEQAKKPPPAPTNIAPKDAAPR